MLTKLTLMRHGETPWNVAGIWQGIAPVPLSDRGIQQANETSHYLRAAGITRIVSSNLLRTRQTADIVATTLKLPVDIDSRWREVDLGRWQGLTNPQIRAWDTEAYESFEAAPYLERGFPDGENQRQHIARTAEAMASAINTYPGEHILVVTHGGSIRCAVYHITGEALHLSGNCSLTRLHYAHQSNSWQVKGVAEDAERIKWG
ncbi:histidine phosphatase family protein [bacterium]|nr:histidine phosphatase family protein [bacterium]